MAMAALPRSVARSIPKNAFSTVAEDVKTSTLSNGIKVVSKEMGSGSAVVGLSVNAGARFSNKGESLLLQHMGFKGSASRSDIKLAREVEAAGLTVNCDSDRDAITYSASGLRNTALSAGIEAVAESALTPKLIDWHVAEMKHEAVDVALEFAKRDPVKMLIDKLHEASFGKHAAMGRAFYQSPAANASDLTAYHSSLFNTSNITVVGSGVSHSDLVSAAEGAFGTANKGNVASGEKTEFVGGYAYSDSSASVCHVAVGFNGASVGGADYVDSLVLKELWKQGAAGVGGNSFNITYQDAGVIGVYGSCPVSGAGALTDSIVAVMKAPISDAQVAAAKMAVKTQIAVSAENASNLFSLLASNGSVPNVDKVTAASVKALATKLTKTAPALASVGPDTGIPAYNTFAKMF